MEAKHESGRDALGTGTARMKMEWGNFNALMFPEPLSRLNLLQQTPSVPTPTDSVAVV